jgi:EmrB/QacA subfamily drug resistance transporter
MLARTPSDAGVIHGRKPPRGDSASIGSWVLVATILGSSMVFIDGTVVNVILPVLQANLHATSVDLQWVVVGYTLFLSSLMLVGGSLGDHYGRRRVFALGVLIFAAASAWCGLAGSARDLVLARAVQGVGSALLTPGSLAIIGASFNEADRGKAIGTWSSFTAITAALGPVLGGWLAEHASWRWVFFINIPLAIAVLVITFWRVPESQDDEKVHHVDWLGALLSVVGLGGIVFALTFASTLGWAAPSVIVGLATGSLALGSFILVEARSPSALMPLELFASRTFAGVNLLTFVLYGALAAVMFFLPFDLIQVQGYTPTEAGLSMLPFIALIFLFSPFSGGLVRKYGAKLPLVVGPLTVAAGCTLLAFAGTGRTYWTTFLPSILVLGIGMALAVAPLTTAVMGSAGPNRVGVASGVNNAISRVASMMAIAVFGLMMAGIFSRGLERRLTAIQPPAPVYAAVMNDRFALAATTPPKGIDVTLEREIRDAIVDAYLAAFRATMLVCAALAATSAAIAAVSVERHPTPI